LESGRLVSGPVVESFEHDLSSYLGVRYAACVSSGTAALHLGLMALEIRPGDEVIVPAFSYPATANVVELAGAKPIFVDSSPEGFNINATALENSITNHTKAIMVVHSFGWPAEIKRIKLISARYNLPLFEDAACALGSSLSGVRCGALGHLAAFSFHPRKILTTGEGGALITNDPVIWQKVLALRNHGQPPGSPGEFIAAGFNYRITEFQAALGRSQLTRFDAVLQKRRAAAGYYDKHLSKLDWLDIFKPDQDREINYQTYVAYVKNGSRDDLIEYLRSKGISAGIGTYSIPHTSFYRLKYGFAESDFPHSRRLFRDLISLPLFDGISRKEQDRVLAAIRDFAPPGSAALGHRCASTLSQSAPAAKKRPRKARDHA
jgi:dTDP-4-amino-4,6-dideoxygalactose transaminase